MKRFNVLELENIKNNNMPWPTIRRQIANVLQYSSDGSAIVEFVEKNTGRYRIVLEGHLGVIDNLDSSYYIG